MATILTTAICHIVSMLWGMTASFLGIGFFYVLGRRLVPDAFKPVVGRRLYCVTSGTVLYIACCWYSIKWGIPLTATLSVLGAAAILLLALEVRNSSALVAWHSDDAEEIIGFIRTFALYYFIAYAFLPSAYGTHELPLARGDYNHDVFHYMNSSAYLQRLGGQNIAGIDYLGEPYWVTPSALYFFDLMAVAFGGDVMSAANPLLYAVIAVIGYAASMLARRIFDLSFRAGIVVGAIGISGSFFWYVYGNGFFPQFISSAVLLLGMLQTQGYLGRKRRSWKELLGIAAVYNFILLYTYPALWIFFLLSQALFVFFAEGLSRIGSSAEATGAGARVARLLFWWGGATAAAWTAIAVFDWGHFHAITTFYIVKLSSAAVGWPLDILPMYSLLGLPGPLQPGFGICVLSYVIGFSLLAVAARACLFRPTKDATSLQRAAVLTASVAYLAYVVYYAKNGNSYQQWKFAAYFPLLWSWVWLAVLLKWLLDGAGGRRRVAAEQGAVNERMAKSSAIDTTALGSRKPDTFASSLKRFPKRELIIMFVAIGIVGKNFLEHRLVAQGVPKFEQRYSNLSAIDGLGGFDRLYVYMNTYATTFLAPYFIRSKQLDLLSESYYPKQPYDPADVSPAHPLFLDGVACSGPDSVAIKDVGCLFKAVSAVSIEFGRVYEFSKGEPGPFLMTLSGFSMPESWGIWALASNAQVELSTSSASLDSHPQGYLNLFLRPYLPAGRQAQRVAFHLAGRDSDEIGVSGDMWISIPYQRADWDGQPLAKLRLSVDLLDAIAPADIDQSNKDARKIGMGFVSLSLSPDAKGKPVPFH